MNKLLRRKAAKYIIIIMLIISSAISAFSICGTIYAQSKGVFDNSSEEENLYENYRKITDEVADDFIRDFYYVAAVYDKTYTHYYYCSKKTYDNIYCNIIFDNVKQYADVSEEVLHSPYHFEYTRKYYEQTLDLHLYVDPNLKYMDRYYNTMRTIRLLYQIKPFLIPFTIVFSILFIICFTLLIIISTKKSSYRHPFPFDVYMLLSGVAAFLYIYGFLYISDFYYSYSANCNIQLYHFILASLFAALGFSIITLFITSFISRCKSKCMFKSFLVIKICRLIGMLFCKIFFIVRVFLISLLFIAIETFLMFYSTRTFNRAPLIIAVSLILIACIYLCCYAFMLKSIKKIIHSVSTGNMSCTISKKDVFHDIKSTTDDLNNINAGILHAVEERMKSEHLKTELITNVSHDIKTPLTSIINYADLLSREELNNEKAMEYIATISKHSERLKRLIEDLIEASKASSGNLEVSLEKSDIGIMLTQIAGEYEEKALAKNLQFIINKPEEPVHIMADGRRMFRVFDNLLSNICKYSMPGTRVYLTLTYGSVFANIEFKNISEYELNITSDELMERFVRGDVSRHTDGNGLGLSIAKDLAKLQNGTMKIEIDGDLYKVTLSFPLYHD